MINSVKSFLEVKNTACKRTAVMCVLNCLGNFNKGRLGGVFCFESKFVFYTESCTYVQNTLQYRVVNKKKDTHI